MKTFDKSSKLEHVAYDIRGPVLDEANRLIANGEKILRLNTGNPAEFGFTAPDEVIRDLIMNVSQLVRLLCSIASLRASQMWILTISILVTVFQR